MRDRPARQGLGHNVCVMEPKAPPLPEDDGFWYPRWREMWEESFDGRTRSRITKTVRSGRALVDPVEARYAVTLARRDRLVLRWWPVLVVVYLGVSLAWLIATISSRSLALWTWSDWTVGTLHAVAVVALGPLAYRRYRLVVDAERLNREVVASQESDS